MPRPGGRLAWVTRLETVGLERRGDAVDDGRAGDLPSVRAAADQVRRAGFRDVRAFRDSVMHAFTPESCLGFLAGFDEEDLFAGLDAGIRGRLDAELLGRLRTGPAADLRTERPVVYVTGVRPRAGR